VQASSLTRPTPDFKAGDVLELRMVIPEAGRKEYLYKGVCIARYNKGIRSAFKIFNTLPDSGGFVQHLPLYMPGMQLLYLCRVHLRAQSCNLSFSRSTLRLERQEMATCADFSCVQAVVFYFHAP